VRTIITGAVRETNTTLRRATSLGWRDIAIIVISIFIVI